MSIDLSRLNTQQRIGVTAPLVPVLVLAGAGSGKTRVLAYRIAYLLERGDYKSYEILALTFTNKAAKEMQQRVNTLLQNQESSTVANLRYADGFGKARAMVGERITNQDQNLSTLNSSAMPTMGTFHGLGVKILHQFGHLLALPKVFTIIDSEDALKIIKTGLAERGVGEAIKPQAVLHFIHKVKNSGFSAEKLAEEYRGYLKRIYLDGYEQYQRALQKQGVVDLDDLILLPVQLFRSFPEVRSYYQNKFKYILVDEYQDTNPVQYQFIRLLCPPSGIFVVGDDAQSIYGFRGSDITNILNFERDFKDAKVIVLDQNYRSTQNILAVADTVLKHSAEQKPKTMWTENHVGQKVVVKELANEYAEAEFVAGRIVEMATSSLPLRASELWSEHGNLVSTKQLNNITIKQKDEMATRLPSLGTDGQASQTPRNDNTQERPFSVLEYMLGQRNGPRSNVQGQTSRIRLPEKHGPLSKFAVLYRTHAQSRALEEALLKAEIPYRIFGGLKFYDRAEVKDALSALKILLSIRNDLALGRVLSKPNNGIGEKTIAGLKEIVAVSYESRVMSQEVPVVVPLSRTMARQGKNYIQENLELVGLVRQEFETLPQTKSRTAVINFLKQLESWLEAPVTTLLSELLLRIINELGFIKLYSDGTEAGDARVENLLELVSVSRQYDEIGWQESLPTFLESVALVSELDASSDEAEVVTLLTLHSAKGLEFDVVFFVGLEEGILPHSRSMMEESALAEEVRLAYVGITRARHELYMTYVRERGIFGESRASVPSRLLKTLPSQAVSTSGLRAHFLPKHELSDGGVEYEPFEE